MANFLERAEQIAREAHAGQRYVYDGGDYIDSHVSRVVKVIRRLGYGPKEQAVGWLHDTVEDTPMTLENLRVERLPLEVVTAVDLVSKIPGVAHDIYLAGIATEPLAIVGKFADSSVNYAANILLTSELRDEDFRNWGLEYAGNIAYLRPLLPEPGVSTARLYGYEQITAAHG
jgi:hypothetical protein